MKTKFLFPHYSFRIGLMCFVIDLAYTILMKIYHPQGYEHLPGHPQPLGMAIGIDIHILTVVVGLFLIAFAKEKIEDEHIAQLRLDSLQWALFIYYIIFIVCTLVFHGYTYLYMVAGNVVTPLICFILRFRWKIYMFNRSIKSELSE